MTLFSALLVSVIINDQGKPIEKHWAAFFDMQECQNIAKLLTSTMRNGNSPVVYRCDPVPEPKPKK